MILHVRRFREFIFRYGILGWFGIGTFFAGLGNSASQSLSTLYNDTLGKITSTFNNEGLNMIEQTILGALAAALAFFAYLSSVIGATIGQVMYTVVMIAATPILGIGPFGPVIAFLILLAIGMFVLILIKLLIELA